MHLPHNENIDFIFIYLSILNYFQKKIQFIDDGIDPVLSTIALTEISFIKSSRTHIAHFMSIWPCIVTNFV